MRINIGILGLGTVGCGTVAVLQRNSDLIAQRAGCELRVTRIATKTPGKPRAIPVDPALVSGDVEAVLNDPEIQIVAELIGGVDPARDYVLRAIAAGKSVVTANKELIAKHGFEILAAADRAGVDFLFEGSVGGGIPLIAPLRESLVGNRVTHLMAILNGTTNYILTRMAHDGCDFDAVLREAQALGYAETDPSADVDGFDTMYKLAILGSIAFGVPVKLENIHREGIRKVGARDIAYARELGYVIKLIAFGRRHENGEIELRVHPALLPSGHPLASVNDVFNAVLVTGDAVGNVMFYGRGAGGEPTGSAVVGDLVAAARNLRNHAAGRVGPGAYAEARYKNLPEVETRFCLRMQVNDQSGTLARIAAVFGEHGVSIDSLVQKHSEGGTAEIFWVTKLTSEAAMAASLDAFRHLEAVVEVSSVLRVEGE